MNQAATTTSGWLELPPEAESNVTWLPPRPRRPSDYELELCRELSELALEWVVWRDRRRPRPPPRQLEARWGFADAPRRPCYRAPRRK